jgi:hypothetical protein
VIGQTRETTFVKGVLAMSLWTACVSCTPIDTPGPEHLDADEGDGQTTPIVIDGGGDGGADAGEGTARDAALPSRCAADASPSLPCPAGGVCCRPGDMPDATP